MVADRLGALGELRTLDEMTTAFADEDQCRDVLEVLVWPNGVVCPFCNSRNCRRRGGQDYAKGRWRCGEGACRVIAHAPAMRERRRSGVLGYFYRRPNRAATKASAASAENASGSKPSPIISIHSWYRACAGLARMASSSW